MNAAPPTLAAPSHEDWGVRMRGFFSVPGWVLPFVRRVLYFWVRTTVFPERLEDLGLDPGKQVCYVLQNRHLYDLLVLDEETRQRLENLKQTLESRLQQNQALALRAREALDNHSRQPPAEMDFSQSLEQVQEQLQREPRPYPRLEFVNGVKPFDQYEPEDFALVGYDPHPAIKAPVAV